MADGMEKPPEGGKTDKAQRGGNEGRAKAERREREFVARLKAAGVYAEIGPFGGEGLRIFADGKKAAPWAGAVKARADGRGFRMLENWIGSNQALFLAREKGEPIAVLPWAVFAELMKSRVA